MKTAKEYWKEKFDEEPQNDGERLACAMMSEYAQYFYGEKLAKNISSNLPVMRSECDHDRHYSEIDGFAYCNKCGTPMA